MTGRRTAPAALAVTAGIMMAATASTGDPVAGQRIAERWCSSCHAGATGRSGTDSAPALGSIAEQRRGDPGWLRAWLTAPHPPMPDPGLSRAEIEDIVAYLERLPR